MAGEDDEPEHCQPTTTNPGSGPVGRETLAVVLDSIERANARASESAAGAVEAVQGSMRRVFLIVLAILLLLAAVLGIAVQVDTPSGSIGLDPTGEAAPK